MLKSTAGGTLGILLPYRTCSMSGRRRKTSGPPCGATNRRVGIECEDRRARGFSLGRGLDPKPRTIWQRYPRGHTCSSQSLDWPLLASTGRAEAVVILFRSAVNGASAIVRTKLGPCSSGPAEPIVKFRVLVDRTHCRVRPFVSGNILAGQSTGSRRWAGLKAEIPIHTRSTTLRIRRGFQGLGRSS